MLQHYYCVRNKTPNQICIHIFYDVQFDWIIRINYITIHSVLLTIINNKNIVFDDRACVFLPLAGKSNVIKTLCYQ